MPAVKGLFLTSCVLLVAALGAIFQPAANTWFPRDVAMVVALGVVSGWLARVHWAFRVAQLPIRWRVAGWFVVAGMACFFAADQATRFYILGHWPSWHQQLGWLLIGVAGLLFFGGIALRVLRGESRDMVFTAPYTVESEVPDHVVHIQQESKSLKSSERTSSLQ